MDPSCASPLTGGSAFMRTRNRNEVMYLGGFCLLRSSVASFGVYFFHRSGHLVGDLSCNRSAQSLAKQVDIIVFKAVNNLSSNSILILVLVVVLVRGVKTYLWRARDKKRTGNFVTAARRRIAHAQYFECV